ncbi:enoyl-CoA hydratase/isomerase family protein [Candidatus Puniceispirillum sp.]|nr:enoyl-CoA hydratase/isomerase family protein [Candidatus Puniceispirillum sp.]
MLQDHNHKNVNDNVHYYVVGVVGVVVLDRPETLNALNYDMVWLLRDIFVCWKDDPAIGHVVICSSASRAFCAGGDIRQVREALLARNVDAADLFFQGEYLADLAIAEFGKPVIALCDGLVMGGGAGLAEHSSHIIVTETTQFAMPESSIGLFPDVGASLFLGRCPIPVARLLGMTGYVIDGASCIMLGLASAMVSCEQIEALRKALLKCETAAIDQVITSYRMDPGLPALNQHMPSINHIFGSDVSAEEMQNRAQDLYLIRPNDTFVKQVVTAFAEHCPFSIKLFCKLLKVTEGFESADQAISLDYNLALRMIRRPDFVEGVRALLVDKDKNPRWAPDQLNLVDEALLEEVFNQDGLWPLR